VEWFTEARKKGWRYWPRYQQWLEAKWSPIAVEGLENFTGQDHGTQSAVADRLHLSQGDRLGLGLPVDRARRFLPLHRSRGESAGSSSASSPKLSRARRSECDSPPDPVAASGSFKASGPPRLWRSYQR
jgi:hypothetical protein